MSRRRQAEKRKVLPDAKFGDMILPKLINSIMVDGKKSVAEKIVYGALDIIETKVSEKESIVVFHEALANIKPKVEVKSRRVGGATYQVPIEVNASRGQVVALRWLTECARNRSEHTMEEKLAGEILDAYNERGNAIKKRDDTHRMADANKAFAHFRW